MKSPSERIRQQLMSGEIKQEEAFEVTMRKLEKFEVVCAFMMAGIGGLICAILIIGYRTT